MMDGLGLDAHWVWMILAALLGTIEIVMPGFFLIWIGLAALLTGLATLGFGLGEPAQFATFAALSVGAVYAGRRWFAANPIESTDPMLNLRSARLVGEIVEVVEPIVHGSGRVRVADGVWPAKGPDSEIGARLRVTGVDGTCLIVESVPALPKS